MPSADDEYDFFKGEKSKSLKQRLGVAVNPLDQVTGRVCGSPNLNLLLNWGLKQF